jgi:hypothetical protein
MLLLLLEYAVTFLWIYYTHMLVWLNLLFILNLEILARRNTISDLQTLRTQFTSTFSYNLYYNFCLTLLSFREKFSEISNTLHSSCTAPDIFVWSHPKLKNYQQTLIKVFNIKFHENPSTGNRVLYVRSEPTTLSRLLQLLERHYKGNWKHYINLWRQRNTFRVTMQSHILVVFPNRSFTDESLKLLFIYQATKSWYRRAFCLHLSRRTVIGNKHRQHNYM